MISRRAFLASLSLASCPSLFATTSTFSIGISEAILNGQMKPEAAQLVFQSMSGIFEVPGKPKPRFQFAGSTALAQQLQTQRLDLAVVTGIEYGWLSTAHPELVPLVAAFVSDIRLKACILVPADSELKTIADLKGKSIVLPQKLQFHTCLYLHHEIKKAEGDPLGFFDQTVCGVDTNDGMETVVDKKAEAILIDQESWRVFQERKPGRSKKLKLMDESEAFPTAAVLYHPSTWKAQELAQLKGTMCEAHEKPFTRQILNYWRISKFVPCCAEYQSVVQNILKEIPKPVQPAAFGVQK